MDWMQGGPVYSRQPEDGAQFTQAYDRFYGRFAPLYDKGVKWFPLWKRWLRQALPYLQGPRVLEVSFGTGYLLTQWAGDFEAHGLDYNQQMVAIARQNLASAGLTAYLVQGDVAALPYADGAFNTVVNTMAFSGYPNARRAMSEMTRVLKPKGRLVIVDIGYPADGDWLGTQLTKMWQAAGDLIRDMDEIFQACDLDYTEAQIGGWGSVHRYVATKRSIAAPGRGCS